MKSMNKIFQIFNLWIHMQLIVYGFVSIRILMMMK